jgi:hypothetical protein
MARAKTEIVAASLAHGDRARAQRLARPQESAQRLSRRLARAHEFGFLRMWSIHPSQIQPIVDAMKPDLGESPTAPRSCSPRSATTGADPVPGRAPRPRDVPLFLGAAAEGQGHGVTFPKTPLPHSFRTHQE